MKTRIKKFCSLLLVAVMSLSMGIVAFAGNTSDNGAAQNSYETLREELTKGDYHCKTDGTTLNFQNDWFETEDGGQITWVTLTSNISGNNFFNTSVFATLTERSKMQFLRDQMQIANAMVEDTSHGHLTGDQAVTTDTVDRYYRNIQSTSGMGSQLLATLMSETQPDYASAMNLYRPFSGVVGTALAIIAILIMALLGLTMALDIAYITIPAFQMMCGGGSDGGGGRDGKKKGIGGIISVEARKAVEQAEGGSGGQGGSGEYKAAVGIYLKHRVFGLCILGICLLYLVQGQIYNFVAWFVDLFSGFLGF